MAVRNAIDQILAAAGTALNLSPGISGCPDTVAMLAAPAILREAASQLGLVCAQDAEWLSRWADEIDDRATGDTRPSPSDGGEPR